MGVFGDRLRREREMRGITLDEIAESTKISRRHLDALERDHFDQLPGGVFNKGFVRAYARFLGIDEDQAVADYSLASNEQPEPEDKFPLEIHEEPNRELNPRRSNLPLVFALAALVGVLVGYFFWLKSKPKAEHGAASPQEAALQEPASKAPASSANSSVTSHATVKSPEPPTQPQPAGQEPQKPAEKKFSVLIKAKEDSWITIVADGKASYDDTLTADSKKKFRAARVLVLTTRNAGGIDVLFNGRPLGALGNENERRTLTFNATGLVQ
ncbi:MAG TPA: RodZ domain-containing protein [Candidatus Angelobacter sp.]|nr:RodZ domain-containing protein [Candidatus Angelobacter sp.]